MGKAADIEPRWLVSLMCVWAIHARAADNHHLGYPNKVAWLSIPGGGSSPDPTGFCAQDFTELEAALDDLKGAHLGQFMAMMMYYKPWGVKACIAEGWPFGDSTYYKRLHAAHAKVSQCINAIRERTKINVDFLAEVE